MDKRRILSPPTTSAKRWYGVRIAGIQGQCARPVGMSGTHGIAIDFEQAQAITINQGQIGQRFGHDAFKGLQKRKSFTQAAAQKLIY